MELSALKPGPSWANHDEGVTPAGTQAFLQHFLSPSDSLPNPTPGEGKSGSLTTWPLVTVLLGAAREGTLYLNSSGPQGLGLRDAEAETSVMQSRACDFSPPGPATLLEEAGEIQPAPHYSARAWTRSCMVHGLKPGHQHLPLSQGFCGSRTQKALKACPRLFPQTPGQVWSKPRGSEMTPPWRPHHLGPLLLQGSL